MFEDSSVFSLFSLQYFSFTILAVALCSDGDHDGLICKVHSHWSSAQQRIDVCPHCEPWSLYCVLFIVPVQKRIEYFQFTLFFF